MKELKKFLENIVKEEVAEETDSEQTKLKKEARKSLSEFLLSNFFSTSVEDAKNKDYSYAILVLDSMRMLFFKHKDEMVNAIDTLQRSNKRTIVFKKNLEGLWIKPETIEI